MNSDTLRDIATRMADALWHRGPDDLGVWVDETEGIALGFRRLAIIDLTTEGRQPMISASGRFVVVFNGEIYNFRQLRRDLEREHGCQFRGHSDTEVLLASVEHWGLEEAVRRFVGMFAFALWDRKEARLHLVRDRVGEKPLYYGWVGDSFVFGSELKSLRAHPHFSAKVSREALGLYMRMQFVPGSWTIYEKIHKLQPGCILSLHHPSLGCFPHPVPYWEPRAIVEHGESDPFRGTPEEAVDQLESLLRNSVCQQMVADVPLGAFLSGGIDSSLIVALMQKQSTRPVKTFTIGFNEPRYNEATHARRIAQHLGTDHAELYVSPVEASDTISTLPRLFDEPFADSSQIPTYLVAKLARNAVTVSLSGDGGDELFAGYDRQRSGHSVWRRIGWLPRTPRKSLASLLAGVPSSGWNRMIALGAGVLPSRFGSVAGSRIHSLLADLATSDGPTEYYFQRLYPRIPELVLGFNNGLGLASELIEDVDVSDLANRFSYVDLATYLPGDIMVKVDRCTMGVSLESRAPLLDHRVVEFAWRLGTDLKWRGGQSKWILRRLLSRYVPPDLFERPKMGFGIPVGEWIRDSLRDWAEDLLDQGAIREEGFLNEQVVRTKWEEHLSGSCDHTSMLWNILMFEGWLRNQSDSYSGLTNSCAVI